MAQLLCIDVVSACESPNIRKDDLVLKISVQTTHLTRTSARASVIITGSDRSCLEEEKFKLSSVISRLPSSCAFVPVSCSFRSCLLVFLPLSLWFLDLSVEVGQIIMLSEFRSFRTLKSRQLWPNASMYLFVNSRLYEICLLKRRSPFLYLLVGEGKDRNAAKC